MMENLDRQIVADFRHRLEEITLVLDVRIFGSRARGDAQIDSDLDVFVKVAQLDRSLREKIYDLAWKIGFKYERVISTFVVTEKKIKDGAVGANPLLSRVMEEGIVI
ncbi:MAG: nucleotidyltransferase family protein [Crocosphaera sp.]